MCEFGSFLAELLHLGTQMHVTTVYITALFLFPVVLRFLGKGLGRGAPGLIPSWEYVGHVTGEGAGW